MSERQVRTGVPAKETVEERAARVRRLQQSVRDGTYTVNEFSLAQAMMAWEPQPGRPHPSFSNSDDGLTAREEERRGYKKEWMRQRRARDKQRRASGGS